MWLYLNCGIMVSYAMPSEGSKVIHIYLRFPALPYTESDPGFLESFHNISLDFCEFYLIKDQKD